jgi:hypothetical protein
VMNINQSRRVLVGSTKNPDVFQVWHPVLGKNSPPRFVSRDAVLPTIEELLRLRDA